MKIYLSVAIFAMFCASQTVSAISSQKLQNDLEMITNFATSMCQTSPVSSTRTELNAKGKLDLNAFFRKLTGLNIGGEGEIKIEESTGVLQKDLVKVIVDGNNCRLEIWRVLKNFINNDDEILEESRKVDLGNAIQQVIELDRKDVFERIRGGIQGMLSADVDQYLIATIPTISGGITCNELITLLDYALTADRSTVVKGIASYIQRPFPVDCFAGISQSVLTSDSAQTLIALQNSQPKY